MSMHVVVILRESHDCLLIVTLLFFRTVYTIVTNRSGATSGIHKIRSVFRLEDEAYWIRRAASISKTIINNSLSTAQSTSHQAASTQSSEAACALLSSCAAASSPSPSSSQTFSRIPSEHRPVVFLSIQEHHSNLLPWRDCCADVVVIPENSDHQLDLVFLEEQLILHQDRPLKLGTFSAGSNLTGVLVSPLLFHINSASQPSFLYTRTCSLLLSLSCA